MNTVAYINSSVIPAAMKLLPTKMDSPGARAELLAIGLQESRFTYRKQIGGPARGFWQFEAGGGVYGVLTHRVTAPIIAPILDTLRYAPTECYQAITDNDILAAVFARLLLWSSQMPLAERNDSAGAWALYADTWRPGRPHREAWDVCYAQAWNIVDGLD